MILDETGRMFILKYYPTATVHSIMNDTVIESSVNEILRVPINVKMLSQNAYNSCVSICRSIGVEEFKKGNLVKYINNSVHITNIGIKDDYIYKQAMQFVKAGIAYWIIKLEGDLDRRKDEIKLYFS